jgi:ferric-dicitrate binding protein FerR (iron transport regulator)
MKKTPFLFLLLLPACAWPTAERPLKATLTEAKGDVQVIEAAQASPGDAAWKPARPGVVLTANARLKTGSDGSADLIFDDGTALHVDRNASLTVETSRSTEDHREFSIRLWAGRLLSQVMKNNETPVRYRVRTPDAVAAVRGTEFVADASTSGAKMAVFEGQVETQSMKDDSPLGDAVTLQPDQEVAVESGRPVGPPQTISQAMSDYRRDVAALFQARMDGYRNDMEQVRKLQEDFMDRRRRETEGAMEERRKGTDDAMQDFRRKLRQKTGTPPPETDDR